MNRHSPLRRALLGLTAATLLATGVAAPTMARGNAAPARPRPTDGLAHVWGRVTGEHGVGLGFVQIGLFSLGGDFLQDARTDDNGYYELSVDPGTYKVQFSAWDVPSLVDYVPEFYRNAPDLASASPVALQANRWKHLNARLKKAQSTGGTISGRITDSTGFGEELEVVLVNLSTGEEMYNVSDMDGNYSYPDLPAGSYALHFATGDFDAQRGWVSEWWKDAATQAGATTIKLRKRQTIDNINPVLEHNPPPPPAG